MAQGRSIWGQVLQNFLASFRKRNIWGELRGIDSAGTHYYESPKSLQGHNRPSRWFAPRVGGDFQQEIPPEWEAWLRYRRKDPPTEEEIQLNLLEMRQRIENAKKFEKPKQSAVNEPSISTQFPVYEEFNDLSSDKSQKKT